MADSWLDYPNKTEYVSHHVGSDILQPDGNDDNTDSWIQKIREFS